MIKYFILTLLYGFSATAMSNSACVRNFLKNGLNTCESGSKDWVYVVNVDNDALFETCTKRQPDSFCHENGFALVISKPKLEPVCVQRFDLDTYDFCIKDPEHYSYVKLHAGW